MKAVLLLALTITQADIDALKASGKLPDRPDYPVQHEVYIRKEGTVNFAYDCFVYRNPSYTWTIRSRETLRAKALRNEIPFPFGFIPRPLTAAQAGVCRWKAVGATIFWQAGGTTGIAPVGMVLDDPVLTADGKNYCPIPLMTGETTPISRTRWGSGELPVTECRKGFVP